MVSYLKGALSQTEERYQETESQAGCAEERGGGGREGDETDRV